MSHKMEATSRHELLTGTLSINSNKQINYLDTLAKVGFLAIFSVQLREDQWLLWLDDNIDMDKPKTCL